MINIASKAGSYLKASSQVVGNGLKPLAAAVSKQHNVVVEKQEKFTVESLIKALPQCGNIGVRSGIPGETFIHLLVHFLLDFSWPKQFSKAKFASILFRCPVII